VEFITLEFPDMFLTQEINATRLAELLLFLINRTTNGTDAKNFDSLLKLDMPTLDKINHVSILAPVAGILINLDRDPDPIFPFPRAIASTGGFTLDAFLYLCSFEWKRALPDDPIIEEKATQLAKFVQDLQKEVENLKQAEEQTSSRGLKHSSSSDFCSICCSAPIDTAFEPCKHSSCSKCIKRHLLNSKKCFYCNAEIVSLRDLNGEAMPMP